MKRFGHLFEKVCEQENLHAAFINARRGKRRRDEVCEYEKNLETNITQLHEELTTQKYKTSKYIIFKKFEPKERVIYKLPFRDRIVHWAIMQVMEPIWTATMTADVYACVRGRGIHLCLRRLREALRNDRAGTQYCLKMDIRKFYPSVDHTIMKQVLRKKIKDARMLALLDEIVDSTDGLPIGNYLSQYFANIYLTELDHLVKEQLGARHYFRYADDMVLLAPDKPTLHAWRAFIENWLLVERKLDLKHDYQVFPVAARGVDFVGYVAFHTHCRARKRNKQSMCRTLSQLRRARVPEPQIRLRMASHLGFMKHCNSNYLIAQTGIMKKFSEVSKHQGSLDGDKMNINEIIGRTLRLLAYRVTESRYHGRCLVLQFLIEQPNGEWVKRICFTGSEALIKQLDGVEIDLAEPILCTIVRHQLGDGRISFSLRDPAVV